MAFYQNGILALYKTSDMDDNAIVISDADYANIRAKLDQGGSFSVSSEGAVTLTEPEPESISKADLDQATAEFVVMQYMVKEKVAEMRWEGSGKQYHVGDVVYHNGAMWRATSNNSNNEPDDVPGDWEKVS